jgi:hypothetical protein
MSTETMNKHVKGVLKRLAFATTQNATIARALVEPYVGVEWLLARANPALLSRIVGTQKVGARVPVAVSPQIESMLQEIHSEATLRERRFLYHFFRQVWSGQNSVIEIGPFLGGTTRAIALGMRDNARLSPEAKLLTFDRFSQYYSVQAFMSRLEPLVARGVLSRHDFENLGDRVEFFELFKKIHQSHDYYARVVPQNRPVPDKPQHTGAAYFALPEGTKSNAVFVDGCKSWFGTKFFMREVSKVVDSGSYFIFQDYGHYTCFWIAAFVETFRDHFELLSYVDDTYTFVLVKPLRIDDIEQRFPDAPAGFTAGEFSMLFDRLADEAAMREDYFAVVRHSMQKAAAFAYLDNKSESRAILNRLARQPWALSQRKVIKQALKSPTYTPDGQIFL